MVDGDGAAVVEREDLEQRALLAAAQRGRVAPLHLELAQEPHPQALHATILTCGAGDGAQLRTAHRRRRRPA